MALEMIPKLNISEEVLQQMQILIATGEWKPGDKIPAEPNLAEQFGVSRLTVRNALQQLMSLGLVERVQGRGTFVRHFDGSQLMNGMLPMLMLDQYSVETMFEFRGMLECESARLAALRADEKAIQTLYALNEQLEALAGNPVKEAECDYEFHLTIVKSTGNQMLIQLYELLRHTIIYSMLPVKKKIGSAPGMVHHKLLADAISNRDAEKARSIMWDHMNYSVESYQQNT